jgi:hypothetical protein
MIHVIEIDLEKHKIVPIEKPRFMDPQGKPLKPDNEENARISRNKKQGGNPS